jgi:hypothetical protein
VWDLLSHMLCLCAAEQTKILIEEWKQNRSQVFSISFFVYQ